MKAINGLPINSLLPLALNKQLKRSEESVKYTKYSESSVQSNLFEPIFLYHMNFSNDLNNERFQKNCEKKEKQTIGTRTALHVHKNYRIHLKFY